MILRFDGPKSPSKCYASSHHDVLGVDRGKDVHWYFCGYYCVAQIVLFSLSISRAAESESEPELESVGDD